MSILTVSKELAVIVAFIASLPGCNDRPASPEQQPPEEVVVVEADRSRGPFEDGSGLDREGNPYCLANATEWCGDQYGNPPEGAQAEYDLFVEGTTP